MDLDAPGGGFHMTLEPSGTDSCFQPLLPAPAPQPKISVLPPRAECAKIFLCAPKTVIRLFTAHRCPKRR